jgi:CRP/FNR family cyclic AMP-dependent transcriptional regulator
MSMESSAVGMSALRAMPLFSGVVEHDLENILKLGELKSYDAGQTIIERGDPGDALYILLRGTAGVEAGGRHHELGEGDFFGEMALIAGKERTATVKAVEPVDVLRIGAEDFQRFALHHPQVGLAMLRSLVERLREVQERVEGWTGSG